MLNQEILYNMYSTYETMKMPSDISNDSPLDMSMSSRHCQKMRPLLAVPEDERLLNNQLCAMRPKIWQQMSPSTEHELNGWRPNDLDFSNIQFQRTVEKSSVPSILNHCNDTADIDLHSSRFLQRAKREFVPDEKKDAGYWSKRHKNNDSARRSRYKRKEIEKATKNKLYLLQQENDRLRQEVNLLRETLMSKTENKLIHFETNGMTSAYHQPVKLDDNNISFCLNLQTKEEMDMESPVSDDSTSNDDSRARSIDSISVLNQSLDVSRQFAVSPAVARSISSVASSMSSSESRNSLISCADSKLYSGVALELRSELTRETSESNGGISSSSLDRSGPIKYRMKKGLSSSNDIFCKDILVSN